MGYTEKGGAYTSGRDMIIHEDAANPHPQYAMATEPVVETAGITVVFDSPADEDYIDVVVPFAAEITAVTLLADQSGSIAFDIWKDTYANFPPVVGDSIVASAPPTISTATKAQDTTLTGWTTTLAAGDILRFYVDGAVTDITRCTLALSLNKS
jgi:hypothetical protein